MRQLKDVSDCYVDWVGRQYETTTCGSELKELCQGIAANEANNHVSNQLIGD
jgi:hypothetical protein